MTDYTKYVPHQRPTFTSSAPPEKECTTHHHACGCREAEYAKAILDRQDEIGRLKISTSELEAGNALLREQRDSYQRVGIAALTELSALKDAARAVVEADYSTSTQWDAIDALAALLDK